MKKKLFLLVLSVASISLMAQDVSFDALNRGVYDVAQIKKELILNGFTKITDLSSSDQDTYAWMYNEDEETAVIWVNIAPAFVDSQDPNSKYHMIQVQSFIPAIHALLVEEITENCIFMGVDDDDELVYKSRANASFHISSEDGTNYIVAYPSDNPETQEFQSKQMEMDRQQEIERQEKVEQMNGLGMNAFSESGEAEGSYDTGGGMSNGVTFGGLGSRRVIALPKPKVDGCNVSQRIEVTVDIQVDRNGKVVNATVQKATYQDKCIWDVAVDAALQSSFSADQAANYRQTGWIKYIITP